MPSDLVEKVSRAWASIDGTESTYVADPFMRTAYTTEAEELLKRSGLAAHIKHLEQELARKDDLLRLATSTLSRTDDWIVLRHIDRVSGGGTTLSRLNDIRATLLEIKGEKE